MPLPSGVQTRSVVFSIPLSWTGQPATLKLNITPTHSLLHVASGTPLVAFTETRTMTGSALTVELPVTDQGGFVNSKGNPFTNWAYYFEGKWSLNGKQIPFYKAIQVPSSSTNPVDVDLLPDGTLNVPVITDGARGSGSVISSLTVDTGADYKVIMFSDGTLKAVPASVTAPTTPTGLAAIPGASSNILTWNASTGATRYLLFRNNIEIANLTGRRYRDASGTTGQTYEYRVSAMNTYGMRSPWSAPLSVFMDPALNHPPTVTFTTWPTTIPTVGRCIIRVNATDIDAQVLALSLSVDAGALQSTPDPSAWILTL